MYISTLLQRGPKKKITLLDGPQDHEMHPHRHSSANASLHCLEHIILYLSFPDYLDLMIILFQALETYVPLYVWIAPY